MATITVKDGNGNPITMVVTEVGSDKIPHHVMVGLDADGTTARVLKLNANRELIVNLANTSLAVTGTFFQATQPVSAASLPLPTGAATQATLAQISSAYWADGATPSSHRFALLAGIDPDGNVQAIATDLAGRFLAPAGQATEAKQDTANASLGATTEGAAASDTATSGLVGLFKRLLQRITTLLGVLPGSLTGGGNFRVSVQEALPAGTADIGDVGLVAGTNIIGRTLGLEDATAMGDGLLVADIKHVAIAVGSSGDNPLVAAVPGKRIVVLSICLGAANQSTAATTFHFRSGSTPIFGGASHTLDVDKTAVAGLPGLVLGFNKGGWFATGVNQALNLNLGAAQAMAGSLSYCEVD